MRKPERQHTDDHCHRGQCEHCTEQGPPAEFESDPSATGNFQTTLQVAGVDCAEEVAAIYRALKPMPGVRDVRVNIMSGKAVIVHDESTVPED